MRDLLPNLQAKPASDLRIEVGGDGSHRLRFTTLGFNIGEGALEIVAGPIDTGGGRQQVLQRVYDAAGGYTDQPAGFAEWHPTHTHFHFNDYARYTLRPLNAPGASNRYGEKVTFCLLDTTRVNTKVPGAPKRPVYTSCGLARQGISVGWGDAYTYNLDGQHIDITGLPDGDYELTIELDPLDRLMETNHEDNTSIVSLRIAGSTVNVLGGRRRNGTSRGFGPTRPCRGCSS